MLTSKEGQSIALGIAIVIVWAAATVHTQNRPQGIASQQIEDFSMMSRLRNLPVEAVPSQP
jgi:hypothetical protein